MLKTMKIVSRGFLFSTADYAVIETEALESLALFP